MSVATKLLRLMLPRQLLATLRSYRILSCAFGHYKSLQRQECIDADDQPLPWYTYSAIEYLRQLDFSDKTVFEYGSGNSTLFWAKRCKRVVSVEDNPDWHAKVRAALPANVEYILATGASDYAESICRYPEKFDVIIIDGNYRFECANVAPKMLRDDGFILFDNSDWYEKSTAHLGRYDFIRVDIAGFGPLRGYTWTTSFYFSRSVRLTPKKLERTPMYGTGAIRRTEALQRGELD